MDSILCPVCSNTVESIDHLFLNCNQLIDLRTRLAIWWDVQLPQLSSIDSLLSWSDSLSLKKGQRQAFDTVIITTLWCLWNFRNSSIFGTAQPKKSLILDDVIDRSFFWISSRLRKVKISLTSWLHNPLLACNLL